MADYTSIADISRSIVALLRTSMTPEPIPQESMIDLCSPEDHHVRLGIFLYSIEENRTFINNQKSMNKMGIDLFYLFTAYSSTDEHIRITDEHMILGKLIQVLNSTPILSAALMKGSVQEVDIPIRISFESLNADDMTKVWNFLNIPYKCSVAYKIGPVFIGGSQGGLAGARIR